MQLLIVGNSTVYLELAAYLHYLCENESHAIGVQDFLVAPSLHTSTIDTLRYMGESGDS